MMTVDKGGVRDLVECYGSLENISIITLAPELAGEQMQVIEELVHRGIVVSIGKSCCSSLCRSII